MSGTTINVNLLEFGTNLIKSQKVSENRKVYNTLQNLYANKIMQVTQEDLDTLHGNLQHSTNIDYLTDLKDALDKKIGVLSTHHAKLSRWKTIQKVGYVIMAIGFISAFTTPIGWVAGLLVVIAMASGLAPTFKLATLRDQAGDKQDLSDLIQDLSSVISKTSDIVTVVNNALRNAHSQRYIVL